MKILLQHVNVVVVTQTDLAYSHSYTTMSNTQHAHGKEIMESTGALLKSMILEDLFLINGVIVAQNALQVGNYECLTDK